MDGYSQDQIQKKSVAQSIGTIIWAGLQHCRSDTLSQFPLLPIPPRERAGSSHFGRRLNLIHSPYQVLIHTVLNNCHTSSPMVYATAAVSRKHRLGGQLRMDFLTLKSSRRRHCRWISSKTTRTLVGRVTGTIKNLCLASTVVWHTGGSEPNLQQRSIPKQYVQQWLQWICAASFDKSNYTRSFSQRSFSRAINWHLLETTGNDNNRGQSTNNGQHSTKEPAFGWKSLRAPSRIPISVITSVIAKSRNNRVSKLLLQFENVLRHSCRGIKWTTHAWYTLSWCLGGDLDTWIWKNQFRTKVCVFWNVNFWNW